MWMKTFTVWNQVLMLSSADLSVARRRRCVWTYSRRTSPSWFGIGTPTWWRATWASYRPRSPPLSTLLSWRPSPSRSSAPVACSSPRMLVRRRRKKKKKERDVQSSADVSPERKLMFGLFRFGCCRDNEACSGDGERERRNRFQSSQPDVGDGNNKGDELKTQQICQYCPAE